MNIGLVSDSHGERTALREALAKMAQYGCAAALHMGDGARDFVNLSGMLPVMCAVSGNCDGFSTPDLPRERTLLFEKTVVYMTHGHLYGVKMGTSRLWERAVDLDARVALFGHTHCTYQQTFGGVLLVNPGALANGDFAVLHLTPSDAGVTFYHLD